MFDKILIANRGEIACRVIRTARRMGIATVAVHSDADAQALHVRMADEAIRIGPPAASESYISIDRVMAAIRDSGAGAVHPGYGFLSENPKFAAALDAAGVAFVGPPIGAIEAMGDKITSKKIAAEAGVSTVPGYMGEVGDAEEAARIAAEIGYPVMIKASAGGGGKGMRIAWNDAEAREGFQSSRNEAKASFGDDRIFIEKFVTQPRHIEIQVLADSHGNCVYLGERECSIQRRNQKVVEEAPSPFLDAQTRRAMGEQACALAQAVGYTSAGTVEFIVDGERNFYFLEMNTRLQVEHPVTELITGVDLVEQMIRVAAGEPLGFGQDDIRLTGWAIESRIYAEDPYRNFLPSIGRLTRYRPPAEIASGPMAERGTWHGDAARGETAVRNDTGVFEGGEISMYYDPMIAKLCTWAPDRTSAIAAMRDALDAFELDGIGHNLPFLSAVMDHPRFESGDITTAFIAEEFPDGFQGTEPEEETVRSLAAVAAHVTDIGRRRAVEIEGATIPLSGDGPLAWMVRIGDTVFEAVSERAEAAPPGIGTIVTLDAGRHEVVSDWHPGAPLFRGTVDGQPITVRVDPGVAGVRLRHRGADLRAVVRPPRIAELAARMPVKEAADTSLLLLCPMPGQVVRIDVSEGDTVEAGQALCTVEAMKMENILRADQKGTVARIHAAAGDSLAVDAVIMEFERA